MDSKLELHLRYRREESTSSISLTQKGSEALSLRSFRRHRKEFRSLRFFDGKCLFATGTRVRRRAVSDLKREERAGAAWAGPKSGVSKHLRCCQEYRCVSKAVR